MSEVRKAAEAARNAAQHVATLTTEQKNDYLRDLAGALVSAEGDILRANATDIARAEADGLSTPKLERLGITEDSLAQMAEGLRQVADLDDPVAQVTRDQILDNGGFVEMPFLCGALQKLLTLDGDDFLVSSVG